MASSSSSSLLEPAFQFSNNFSPTPKPHLLHTNFSPKPLTVCTAAINPPPPPPPPEQIPTEVALEAASATRDRRKIVRVAWEKLVRWSRTLRLKAKTDVLEHSRILGNPELRKWVDFLVTLGVSCLTLNTSSCPFSLVPDFCYHTSLDMVVVLGGGSFGTAMASHVAGRKAQMEVNMLVRDPQICQSINEKHFNGKYFPDHKLPDNVIATTDAKTAFTGADYCLHAVPVQFSSSFLEGVADYVEPGLPFISLSKGLELNTLRMMSQIIPQTLKNSRQPFVALSGPSFALELMNKLPTAMVVASKDKKLANAVQQLLASRNLRISTTSDVTGVEIAGALKNVLAIAAGIVEGLDLGNNSMAALVAQGCSEIRWLSTKMGAKSTTISGLSGTGDIMLTCFVSLSRNRTVGVRLGSGETLDDILCSMNQVAEGVSTAGAVIALAQKYNVKMPVLTAVARIIDNELTPQKAVYELMNLPQPGVGAGEPPWPISNVWFSLNCGGLIDLSSHVWAWRRSPRDGIEKAQFDDLVNLLVGFKPTDVRDTWTCSLNSLNTFTVSFMRYAIDSSTLVSTIDNAKWNKTLLIKINIHSWRLCKDRLPTRSDLDARGIDLDSLRCPIGGGWFAPQMTLMAFFLGTNRHNSTQRKNCASMSLSTPPHGSFGAFEIVFALT
ncbi:glycerol-3-phosphate dehydrogenase [NAD(+)] 2, chloroplastic [Tanacetum coccineum]